MKAMSPLEAFIHVLCKYLRDRGVMVLSLASTAGQKKLMVSLYGLWRRHRYWETGYRRLSDILEEITKNEEFLESLKRIGVEEIVAKDNEPYIVIDIEKIRRSLKC